MNILVLKFKLNTNVQYSQTNMKIFKTRIEKVELRLVALCVQAHNSISHTMESHVPRDPHPPCQHSRDCLHIKGIVCHRSSLPQYSRVGPSHKRTPVICLTCVFKPLYQSIARLTQLKSIIPVSWTSCPFPKTATNMLENNFYKCFPDPKVEV